MSCIAKFCANHLRTFSNNLGVKLKSGHAHELVAAFFGYKSKAAMLADTLSPIDSLNQAQFLVLASSQFIEQRRKCLEDLPPDLPDNSILGEALFTCLTLEGQFSGRPFAGWKHLIDILTTEYLLQRGSSILSINFGLNEIAHSNFDKPTNEYIPVPDITGNGVTLTTNMRYAENDTNSESIDIIVTIKLQRIAGHIGYANPEISVSTGGAI
ncbi:MAG: hypothetical protein EPN84_01525 [Legionella sp.]|nr:MAG: hypothetical protein EPN84_01525 [Legionella sp.]